MANLPDRQNPKGEGKISIRAILIGAVLSSALSLAVPYTDIYMKGSELSGCHFGVGPLFLFVFLVAVVNPLLKIVSRRASFNAKELLIIFVMMLVTVGISSYGLTAQLLPVITAPFYYADETNEWAEIFHRHLPEKLYVQDASALKMFYEGAEGAPTPWRLWVQPLVSWSVLIFFFYLFMFCLSRILAKQWIEHERLAFPLVQLPIEIAQAERSSSLTNPFFKNSLMWIGFSIPALIHVINGLSFYFPGLPHINLRPRIRVFEGTVLAPFNRYCFVYPSVIGFAYFLTMEVAFSVWFFWALWRSQICIATALGAGTVFYQVGRGQFSGAFVALVLGTLWVGKAHLRRVFGSLFRREKDQAGYQFTLTGMILSVLGIGIWCRMAGVSLWYAGMLIALFFFLCVGLGRAVCESGLLFAKALGTVTPASLLNPMLGTKRIGSRSLSVVSAIEYTFMFDLKAFLFPALMQGHKVRYSVKARSSRFVSSMALAVSVCVVVSIVSSLFIIYMVGGNNVSQWFYNSGPRHIYSILERSISQPEGINLQWCTAAGCGAIFTVILMFLRRTIWWWGLHPIGYILAESWETERIWFSFFIGWFLKRSILKFGGPRLFKKFKPFFLGLIFGEYGMVALWIIVDVLAGKQGHKLFP